MRTPAKISAIVSLIVVMASGHSLYGQVRLPRLVRDSMVLQRDAELKIWGWAAKGEQVNISFNGKNVKTRTGPDGKWMVKLSPMKAGGPYTMRISASNKIDLNNILIGDVWVCAGQSNMVHYMDLHKERYAKDIAEANFPQIRQFLIPTLNDLQAPASDLPRGNWKTATSGNISRFSVVAYFFAKRLYEKYHVPIGLINASVGGTPIEAWTSEAGLKEFPEILKTIQKNKDSAYVNSANRSAATASRERERRKPDDKGMAGPKKWYETDYAPKHWQTINIPGYWEDQGVKALDGVVWYRREIDVPASMTGVAAKVALGRIVDADHLYINGKPVGNTTYQYPQRRYQVPAGVLKTGKNVFVVRVINNGGKGGFVPDKPYYLAAGGDTIDLKGYWQYKVGAVYTPDMNPVAGISGPHQPSALFNAMVAPITNYAIKGVLWYQGESNADRANEYKKLLPALVADWRGHWKQGEVPFLLVQLPNFMDASYSPSESQWAVMREAQLEGLRIPNTGLAVTIDLGEWNDIHPGNKKPIGERLALEAQRVAYNDKNVVSSGPIYRSHKTEGNKIIVSFDHIGGGLISSDGEALAQFSIAGADKKFVWANAVIREDHIEVWHDNVPEPVSVRYAWADNPVGANLSNKEGLPASPFRTDGD